MSNESRMLFASIAEDHARADHEALASTTNDVVEQLRAAKQRELELLAVIENIQAAYNFAVEMQAEGDDSDIRASHVKLLDALYEGSPQQALREHEAKVLEEAADYFDSLACSEDYRIIRKSYITSLRRMAEERRK